MKKHLLIVCAILLSLAASQVSGQGLTYQDGRLLNSHSRVTLQARTLFGLKANFSNLGEVGYPSDSDADGDGVYIDYVFNDGYINLGEDESTLSAEFGFKMENAKVGADGLVKSFTMNRYRSTASEEVFSESPSITPAGWEIAYQYDWGNRTDRLRYGVIAGLAINKLDFSTKQVVRGNLYVQTAEVSLNGPEITYTEGGTYSGSANGPLIDLQNDFSFDSNTESLVVQDVWGQGEVVVPAEVTSFVDNNGILANFRVGPVLNYRIGKRIHLQASAGVNLTYYHSDITVTETLENLVNNNDFTVFKNVDKGEWLAGYFMEGAAYYYLNNRTAAYSSVQMFDVRNPDSNSVEGVNYDVDLRSTIVFSLGIKLAL